MTPAIDRKTQVRITATTLAEVWAFACQSGEFVGIIGQLADAGAGRCGWGVLHTMLDRMGITDQGERNAIVLELAGVAVLLLGAILAAGGGGGSRGRPPWLWDGRYPGCERRGLHTGGDRGRHSGRNRQRADEGVRVS